jgi:general secretion pathway protein D
VRQRQATAALLCALLCGSAGAIAQERVRLNFVNADLEAVVRAVGHYTGRTFVVDPRVKGTLTLVSEKPMSRQEALAALTAALRLQGYAIVEVGSVSRVVPEAEAKFQGGAVQTSPVPSATRGDQVLTHVFRLKYESAANILPVIRPLVPPGNPVTAYAGSNALVVTDYADNLRRIERVIAMLDTPPASDTEVIELKHAFAPDLASLVLRLTESSAAVPDPTQKVTVLADALTNSLVVRSASASVMRQVKSLVERLDRPAPPGQGIYVVPLRHMEASAMAKTLSSARIGEQAAAPRPGPGGQPAAAASAAAAPIIVADPATNSLIITATDAVYRQLRAVLDKLDVRRAQVFIECLLVEVTSDLAAEFGIQWLTGLERISEGGTAIVGGTNFGDPTQNIVSGARNLGVLGRGLNIGVIQGQVTIPGLGTVTNLQALARALETNVNANILSTPNILTLDNEEARFVVGQNVPFITGQFISQPAAGTVTPFQTIERHDVGLTLRVKPQITEGGTIRLGIYQEVSSVAEQLRESSAGIITNKRALETNVLVDDASIVVLGGLVQDQLDNTVEKVPGLGDIPVLGHLFRYETRRRQKTNLMLFLRPHVVRDESSVRTLTVERYDYVRKLEQQTRTSPHFLLPTLEGPVLPEVHMGQKPGDEPPAPQR